MNKKSNKLISLLVRLDRSDHKRCEQFLASPYFNRSPDLMRLFSELSRRLNKGLTLDKKQVWKGTWGKKPYNDVRFRKYSSDLLRLLEEFIVQEELNQQPLERKKLLLRAINRLEPRKQVESVIRNWESDIDKVSADLPESGDKYLTLFHLERQLFAIANYDARTQDRSNLETIMRHLDVFYISEKLKAYNSSKSTYFSRYHKYKIAFIDPIIGFIRDHPKYLEYPSIAMQYYNYLIELEPDVEDHYRSFKELLLNTTATFRDDDQQTLYQTALNYSSRKINTGKTAFLKEYLEVYRHGLEKEAVFEKGQLDPIQFKNSILIALRNGDIEWTRQYIRNYQDRIPAQYRENAVNFNSANLHFYAKDYDKALDFLRDVEYENITYNLSAKAMLLAIYYETDEFDALDSLFDAILAYLSRHKEIPANYKKLFRNLVSITRKMTRIIPGDKKAVEKLRQEVDDTKAIASLNWVYEKLDELA